MQLKKAPIVRIPGGKADDERQAVFQDQMPLLLEDKDPGSEVEEETQLWRTLDAKGDELVALVLRSNDPGVALAHVLEALPRRFEYACELLYGKWKPALGGVVPGGSDPELRL